MRLKNIVTIGGGTGSFVLLTGLKKYPVNITAIVSMADDGGSTGMLRDELGVLPPGDVRQCLTALSESSETLRRLMNYRFENGGLKGHSFGNLLMSALEKITGDFRKGVDEASEILNIKGEVIPVINKSVRMHIKLKNGKIIIGENNLDHNEEIRRIGLEKIFLQPSVSANEKAIEKIKKADLIIIGPGDHYGSIVPNLLVKGISKEIKNSSAKVVYICNLTNKKGQTENFSLEKYVEEIGKFIGSSRINAVVFNNRKINSALVKKYEKREGKNSVVRIASEESRKYKIIEADLIREAKLGAIRSGQSFIRHDPEKLAKVLMSVVNAKR